MLHGTESQACACLKEQGQDKGWEMAKHGCVSQCAGTDSDPSREGRCPVICHERQGDSDAAWSQSHPSLAVLRVAE